MKKVFLLSLNAVLLLALAIPGWASEKAGEKKAPGTKVISGQVIKVDDKSLTIKAQDETGAPTTVTLTISSETQKPTNLVEGSGVIAEYTESANGNIATKITLKPAS